MKDRTAESVANKLLTRWIVYHSVPSKLHSDCGLELVGNVMSQICEILVIEKTQTTPYRPQSDGQTERTIQTIVHLLKSFVEKHDNFDWDRHIPFVMMAYQAMIHSSTGCSPHLMVTVSLSNSRSSLGYLWNMPNSICGVALTHNPESS